jgi:hypothetical protein
MLFNFFFVGLCHVVDMTESTAISYANCQARLQGLAMPILAIFAALTPRRGGGMGGPGVGWIIIIPTIQFWGPKIFY